MCLRLGFPTRSEAASPPHPPGDKEQCVEAFSVLLTWSGRGPECSYMPHKDGFCSKELPACTQACVRPRELFLKSSVT